LIEAAQASFGIVKWLGYLLVVHAVWRGAAATDATDGAGTAIARVFGAATARTALGLAGGVVLMRVLDFESPSGPNPLALLGLILAARLLEWAAVFALFFASLRPPRVLFRAALRGTGWSLLLDIPAAFLTLVMGYANGAIHMC
jgi:hypothetical protein